MKRIAQKSDDGAQRKLNCKNQRNTIVLLNRFSDDLRLAREIIDVILIRLVVCYIYKRISGKLLMIMKIIIIKSLKAFTV